MKQYLVIGAGRFGSGIIKELYHHKCQVVVVDQDEKILDDIEPFTTHAIVGDLRENDVLDELVISDFDAVFVAIGTDAFSAILITKKLTERNAKKIIAKAINKEIGEILYSLGADRVIYPEEEAGIKIARQELMAGVKEYLEISKNVSAIEIEVPEQMIGETLSSLDFSRKYGLTVSLLIRNGEPVLTHFAEIPFQKGDSFFIIGENTKMNKFKKKFL